MERTRGIVEPLVQPALDKTYAIKENVMNKVDKLLHHEHNHVGQVLQCEECQEVRTKAEEQQQIPQGHQ